MNTPAEQLQHTLLNQFEPHVFGLKDVMHGLCLALIARGHILLEGPPGLGKTLVAKCFAKFLGGEFKRIQCTSDMMPSDMTGIHIYNNETRCFELIPGPLFSNVVLVDEINRTGPKTQSALLQAMEEGGITLDRTTYELPADYVIIAAQNPHEFEGTYPLPESQLDRFLIRLVLNYPDAETENQILKAYDKPGSAHTENSLDIQPVVDGLLDQARQQAASVHISDAVYDYVTQLAAATREHPRIGLGLSSRGSLALMRCARVEAALRGADYVTPDDIQGVIRAVAAHRLIMMPEATLEGIDAHVVLESLLDQVDVPRSEHIQASE